MSHFVPTGPANVTIAVCGEQSAGKTVFLTCIFQSIWTAFPDDVILDFDREAIGNADYFQDIEDQIIANGPNQGTLAESLFPARIFIKPYQPLPSALPPVLSVDIQDFAGRHFRSLANLKGLGTPKASDTNEVKALREVNETLKKADAFVILINSTEIDPINDAPKRNPFGPSVNFLLAHCREHSKPVALLFSQIDQAPRLTEELLHSLPRVQAFERQFTSDHDEAAQGVKPFGVVRRIACYETIEGDLAPRRQTLDSIWRPEPAAVVLDLLRAAMPAINKRLEEETKAADLKKENEEKEARRQKLRSWIAGVAAAAAILLIVGLVLLYRYTRSENHKLQVLTDVEGRIKEKKIASISRATELSLGEILNAHRADRSDASSAVRSAIRNVHTAFGEAAQRLAVEPALEPAYSAEVTRFRSLVPLFDPEETAEWRETSLPLLEARDAFLSDWFATEHKPRERAVILDEAVRQFSAQDEAFARILAEQSTIEKESDVASWQARIPANGSVRDGITALQNIASEAKRGRELDQIARKALVSSLTNVILTRHENGFLRRRLLAQLAPSLENLADGEVRFEVLARDLTNCTTYDDCASRHATLASVIEEAGGFAQGWSSGADNLLRNLLLDLPPDRRREIWSTVASSLEKSYLFSSRSDAWPADIEPLHVRILSRVNAAGDPTLELIERIAAYPIYTAELQYLRDRLAISEALLTTTSGYTTTTTALPRENPAGLIEHRGNRVNAACVIASVSEGRVWERRHAGAARPAHPGPSLTLAMTGVMRMEWCDAA